MQFSQQGFHREANKKQNRQTFRNVSPTARSGVRTWKRCGVSLRHAKKKRLDVFSFQSRQFSKQVSGFLSSIQISLVLDLHFSKSSWQKQLKQQLSPVFSSSSQQLRSLWSVCVNKHPHWQNIRCFFLGLELKKSNGALRWMDSLVRQWYWAAVLLADWRFC